MKLLAQPCVFHDSRRIVAIGDLHGNYSGFVRILRTMGLVDESLAWSARDTHLVQMGDIVGKGGEPGKIFCLLRKLEREALGANSQVHFLLGNHEVMCLLGANTYVTQEEYGDFGDGLVESSFGGTPLSDPPAPMVGLAPVTVPTSLALASSTWGGKSEPPPSPSLKNAEHFRRCLAPFGPLGRWLLQRNSVLKLGDTLFVHAGLTRPWGLMPLEDVNQRVRLDILKYRNIRKEGEATGVNGPIWCRRLVLERTTESERELDEVLDRQGCRRMVVGHTPTRLVDPGCRGRVVELYGGKLVCIDTGIGKAFGEYLSALCLENGDMQAWYPFAAAELARR